MKSLLPHLLISLALLGGGMPARADSAFYPSTTDSLYFGRGYDPVKGSVLGPCVADKPTSPVGLGGPGQRVDMEFIRVDDYSTLRRKVDFSASISARWGLAQASASLDYMESHDFTSNDTYLLTHVRVQNNTIGLTSPTYTETADGLRMTDPAGFYSACGTEFVSTMASGGQFDAILHIFTTSTEDRKNVTAAFSGTYSGVDGAAKFNEEFKEVRKNHRTELHLLRVGGTGNLPNVGPDSVVDYSLKFPTIVGTQGQGAPLVYLVGTQSYSSIVAKSARPAPRDARSPWMEDAIDDFEEAMLRRNDVGYALENPLQFDGFDVARAKAKLAALDTYLKQLRHAAKACSELNRSDTCPPFKVSIPSGIELNRYDHLEVVKHNMTEPLAAPMPPNFSCKLVSATGVWYPWRRDTGKFADCSRIPIDMNAGGTFASSNFDGTYSDNSGECTFQFGCFIKSQITGNNPIH